MAKWTMECDDLEGADFFRDGVPHTDGEVLDYLNSGEDLLKAVALLDWQGGAEINKRIKAGDSNEELLDFLRERAE